MQTLLSAIFGNFSPALRFDLRKMVLPMVVILLLGSINVSQGALAVSGLEGGEAIRAVEEADPRIVNQTIQGDSVSFEKNTLELPDSREDGGEAHGISVTIEHLDESASFKQGDSGLYVAKSPKADVDTVVQPTSLGVRIMTVLYDRRSPSSFSYELDVPKGAELVRTDFGYTLEDAGDTFGTVLPAWAVDSAGRSVPTWYAWEDGTLTQHVDLGDPSIAFPVVADPAWQYSYKFPVTKTASANRSLLKKCFNCYFPVSGAPRAFPKIGQTLPLRVLGFNFEVKFAREFSGKEYYGFQFNATRRHIDGYGSRIIFQFKTIRGKRYLTTEAYIMNDSLVVNNAFYRSGAIQTWKKFANNLNKAR